MHVDALFEYPVKSAAPCARAEVQVAPRGFARDRRWMMVDALGCFVSGRKLPHLVRLRAEYEGDTLELHLAGRGTLRVHCDDGQSRAAVEVWGDKVDARVGYTTADAWLQDALGSAVRLAYMDDRARRPVNPKHAQAGDEVSFADGYPILVLGTASMTELNARVGRDLPITRFRPNLVVATTQAHAEDHWRHLRIGTLTLDLVKPCVRCVFTTVDPERGAFDPSGEPLATLKTYRRSEHGIVFGMNAIARGEGRIQTGAPVQVLE